MAGQGYRFRRAPAPKAFGDGGHGVTGEVYLPSFGKTGEFVVSASKKKGAPPSPPRGVGSRSRSQLNGYAKVGPKKSRLIKPLKDQIALNKA